MDDIKPGEIYEHYKGNQYRIIGVGLHSETHEKLVVYQGLTDSEEFGPRPLWVRPYDMFMSTVAVEGISRPRFIRIEEHE